MPVLKDMFIFGHDLLTYRGFIMPFWAVGDVLNPLT